jgi:enamine deaminase RidA (YjgF/YER057c/UK114 family)
LWVSGQVAIADGKLLATGILGADVDAETGQRCARQCAANVLERVVDAYGGLDRVARVLKLSVYVASAPGFTEQHVVANGASELLVEVLGEAGRHARVAVGVAALPLGSPVEVEAVILVDPERAASATTDPVTGVRRS